MKKQNLKYVSIARYIAAQKNEKKPDRLLDDVLKMIGVISGATAIFAALFYIFGRYYAEGYFGAMNLPSYILTFNLGEYGTAAWFPIVFLIGIGSIPTLIYPLFDILLLNHLKRIFLFLSGKRSPKHINKNVFIKEKRESILYICTVIMIVLVCFLFYQSLIITTNIGKTNGEKYLRESANIIELHSSEPIAIDDGQLISPGNNLREFYVYQGFHLLTKNDGKYYVFKELDPETCKPMQIYIIDEASLDQVILSPAEDLTGICKQ